MKKLTLVLPCYNEAESLRPLIERVLESVKKRHLTPQDFHLIVVNNGSSDDTAQVLLELRKSLSPEYWSTLLVPVNRGYGYGVFQGLKKIEGGIAAWTHADEQCDPEDVFIGWEKIRSRPPGVLIKGKRRGRRLGNWIFSRCFEIAAQIILGFGFHEINAQPKVFDASLLTVCRHPPEGFSFDLYLLIKAFESGWRVEEIPVYFPERKHGQSRWAFSLRSKLRTIRGFLEFMVRYKKDSSRHLSP